MAQIVTTLDATHDVANFDCGTDVLNTWLRQTAGRHLKKMISRTYVLVDEAAPAKIIGFYTVAIRAMTPVTGLAPAMRRRLPGNVPGFTLARLAVDTGMKGRGWGEYLLAHAMRRIRQAADSVGGALMFVDAKDAKAASFYAKYGFPPTPGDPLRLVRPVVEIPG